VGGTQAEPLDAGHFRFSASVESVSRDEWRRGGQSADGPDAEASSLVLGTRLRGAITESFAAEVSLPVAWTEARDAVGEESGTGVGDLQTRLHWTRAPGDWAWGVSAGAYWPVGDLGGEALPANATFSSGTVDPAVGAFVALPRVAGWGCQLSIDARLVVADNDDGSRLGSSFSAVMGWDRSLTRRLDAQVALTYFGRAADDPAPMDMAGGHMGHGDEPEDTGGDWLYLQPFLSMDVLVRPSFAVQATVGGRVPLVQNVRGTQLVESPSVSLGVAQTFRF
jgi:hypothetical protein